MVNKRSHEQPMEVFEVGNACEFGFGGLHAYLEWATFAGPPPSVLVISLRLVRSIDSVGVRCIAQSVRWSRVHHCRLLVAHVNHEVRAALEAAGVLCEFLRDQVIPDGEGTQRRV